MEKSKEKGEYEDDIVFARFISYMKRALLHKKMDYLKHKKYLLDMEVYMSDEEWEELSETNNFNHSFFYGEKCRNEALEVGIGKLSEKQKEVIIQYYYKDKEFKVIAKEMDKDESAVRKLKDRAIKKLKEYLEVENEE